MKKKKENPINENGNWFLPETKRDNILRIDVCGWLSGLFVPRKRAQWDTVKWERVRRFVKNIHHNQSFITNGKTQTPISSFIHLYKRRHYHEDRREKVIFIVLEIWYDWRVLLQFSLSFFSPFSLEKKTLKIKTRMNVSLLNKHHYPISSVVCFFPG